MPDGSNRRTLLRTGAGLATAALGGLAGCIEGTDGGGDGGTGTATGGTGGETTAGRTDDGTGGEAAGDVPDYATWLPAPSAVADAESGSYLFGYLDVAEIRENRDRFGEAAYDGFRQSYLEGGFLPAAETIDSTVTVFAGGGFGSVLVARGSFSADEAAAVYTGKDGGTEAGEHGGYALYTFGTGGAAAVRDGVAVVLPQSRRDDPTGPVETVVDARRGAVDRLTDANDDAATLLAELGTDTSAIGTTADNVGDPYDPETLSMLGLATDLRGDTVRFREVHVYERADQVDASAVREAAASDQGTLGGATDVSVSVSGRVATASATAPADEVRLTLFGPRLRSEEDDEGDDEGTSAPAASFDFSYDADAGRVTVTHAGGETFDDANTGALRYGTESGSFRTWSLPVAAGDEARLEPSGGFESGTAVLVVWEAPEGGKSAVVGRFVIP